MSKRSKNYIDKKKLYQEIIKSQGSGQLTSEALKLFEQLCDNYISQFYYRNADDRNDCRQSALLDCLSAWKKFNPEVSNNAFSFFTQTIKIGLIKGWRKLYPGKLDMVSLDGNLNEGGIYSI